MNKLMFLIFFLGSLFLASTSIQAQTRDCDNAPAPRLTIGQQGEVTPGLPNNFRSGAGIWNRRIGQIPAGGVFDVLDGSVCAGGYFWWQVAYRGQVGWTAEGIVGDYWLAPLNSSPVASEETLSLRVDPFVRQDGDFTVLPPGMMVTVMLSSTPEDADYVAFYLAPTGTSSTPSLLGTDDNLTDGATTQWQVDGSLLGYLSADVYDASGEIIAVSEAFGVVADSSSTGGSNPALSQTFIHSTLGFVLDVSAGWTVEETPTGVILAQNTLQLLVTTAPPSGLPAGDRITFSSITLDTGIDVRRDHIIYQDRTKAVIYNYQGLDRIPVGDLELVILLTDTNPNYDAIDLSDANITVVDRIVATVAAT